MEYGWSTTVKKEVEQNYEIELDESDVMEAHTEATIETYEKCGVEIPLHVWENGFEQGEASDKELQALAQKIAGGDVEKVFSVLNETLKSIYTKKLIELAKAEA